MTETSRYPGPGDRRLSRSRARCGSIRSTPDYNGADQQGFARIQMTIGHGKRCSAAVGYLRPALGRPNLRVETDALVRAHSVRGHARGRRRVSAGRRTQDRRAESEVILSAAP